jgi:hypothetical protein
MFFTRWPREIGDEECGSELFHIRKTRYILSWWQEFVYEYIWMQVLCVQSCHCFRNDCLWNAHSLSVHVDNYLNQYCDFYWRSKVYLLFNFMALQWFRSSYKTKIITNLTSNYKKVQFLFPFYQWKSVQKTTLSYHCLKFNFFISRSSLNNATRCCAGNPGGGQVGGVRRAVSHNAWQAHVGPMRGETRPG